MTSCEPCPAEYYSGPAIVDGPEGGAEICVPIPAGWKAVVDADGNNAGIEKCLHTTFSDWGEETCTTCPDGFICPPQTGALGWQYSCPKGSYCIGGV